MTPQELSNLTRKLRTLKVRINTLKTIRKDVPTTPQGVNVPDSYQIMLESMDHVIYDWEKQLLTIENEFLTL